MFKKLLDNKSIKQKKGNPPVIIALLNPELFYQKCHEIIDSLLFSLKVELTYWGQLFMKCVRKKPRMSFLMLSSYPQVVKIFYLKNKKHRHKTFFDSRNLG